jgi:hypothetical protein
MQRLPGLFLLAGRGFCFSQSLAGNETDHELLPITGVNCGLLNEMMDPHTHKVLDNFPQNGGDVSVCEQRRVRILFRAGVTEQAISSGEASSERQIIHDFARSWSMAGSVRRVKRIRRKRTAMSSVAAPSLPADHRGGLTRSLRESQSRLHSPGS